MALIGANGTGKTTMLKIICKQMPKNKGLIRLGSQVSIGYYDQAQDNLHPDKTIFEEISDSFPELTNTKSEIHWPLSFLREKMYLNLFLP